MGDLILNLKMLVKRNDTLKKAYRKAVGYYQKTKQKAVYAYIDKHGKKLYEKYNNAANIQVIENTRNERGYQVWVCWFQGESNMPEVVKMCYASLLKNAVGHKINLITFDNYRTFVNIPDGVVEKHKKGIIHNTQLGDIVRIFLLAEYGGLWVDASVYISGELPSFNGLEFWSFKCIRNGEKGLFHEAVLYARRPNNILMCFLKDFFIEYWERENKLINFFLLSKSIASAYMNIKSVTDLIEVIPFLNRDIHDLYKYLSLPYNKDEYELLCKELTFHKLSWREVFKKYTKRKELTFYGYLRHEWTRETKC